MAAKEAGAGEAGAGAGGLRAGAGEPGGGRSELGAGAPGAGGLGASAGEPGADRSGGDSGGGDLGDNPGGGWRPRLEAFARVGWEIRRRHPWLAEVPVNRRVPGPNALAHYEHALAVLAGTALTPAEVVASVGLLGRLLDAEARALSDAVQAERNTGVGDEEWWGARDSLFARFDRYPVLTALWEAGGFDQPASFEFGLARLLDSIALLVEQRDVKRDETCRVCGGPVVQPQSGRPRAYCSRACQQRAYRKRRSGPAS
ncbi:TetR/AcrR family transcriptional regulator C-terminal domain-containing protein [Saccharothrix sp. BKS2]